MSERFWRIFICCILATIIGGCFGYFLGQLKTGQNSNSINGAQSGAQSEDQSAKYFDNLVPPIPFFEGPINSSNGKIDTNEKDQRDLEAQEWMAFATFWMLVATSVGIYLLWRTLKEAGNTTKAAKSANDTAREIGEAQTRAYVSCVGGDFCLDSERLVVRPDIKNFGQSPAIGVFMSNISLDFDSDLSAEAQDEMLGHLKNWASNAHYVGEIAAQDTLNGRVEFELSASGRERTGSLAGFAQSGRMDLWITFVLHWDDVFRESQNIVVPLRLIPNGVVKDFTDICGTLSRKQ